MSLAIITRHLERCVNAAIITLLLVSLTTKVFAQQSGRIEISLHYDQFAIPTGCVNASNKGQRYFAYPDMNGRFRFDLPLGSYTFRIYSPGYNEQIVGQVDVEPGTEVKLIIALTPVPPNSGPLEVLPNTLIERVDAPPAEKIAARKFQ